MKITNTMKFGTAQIAAKAISCYCFLLGERKKNVQFQTATPSQKESNNMSWEKRTGVGKVLDKSDIELRNRQFYMCIPCEQ